MKMTQLLKSKDGSWSILKIIIGAAITGIIGTLIAFSVNTSYQRYAWMRDQCYKVATNESLLIETKKNFEKKDIELQEQIDKNNGILHNRITDEVNKREKNDERLMDLFLETLKQQQKQVEIQQEQTKNLQQQMAR